MVFQWYLSDRKFPQVSWVLFCILADLSNAVVWMVSTGPPISNSSSSLNQPFENSPERTNYN